MRARGGSLTRPPIKGGGKGGGAPPPAPADTGRRKRGAADHRGFLPGFGGFPDGIARSGVSLTPVRRYTIWLAAGDRPEACLVDTAEQFWRSSHAVRSDGTLRGQLLHRLLRGLPQ